MKTSPVERIWTYFCRGSVPRDIREAADRLRSLRGLPPKPHCRRQKIQASLRLNFDGRGWRALAHKYRNELMTARRDLRNWENKYARVRTVLDPTGALPEDRLSLVELARVVRAVNKATPPQAAFRAAVAEYLQIKKERHA